MELLFKGLNPSYPNDVGIEVTPAKNFRENERKLLQQSGLDRFGKTEAWTALGTSQKLSYATHGIFRYFGKFPPPIATYLIHFYTKENDFVLDPMCGSGTSAVESLFLHRRSIMNDLNPLSMLLTKVKTTRISEEILQKRLDRLKEEYHPLSQDEYPFEPVALRDPAHWFLAKTSDSLRGLKYLIEQEKDPDLKDFLSVIFASTVRRVSKATTQQGRLFLDVDTTQEDALPTFVKRYTIGMTGLQQIPEQSSVVYCNQDARNLKSAINHPLALIILHPPYFNSYKYSSINSLETGWLGIDRNAYRKQEIREFFKVGKPENYRQYVDDMTDVLSEMLPLLKNGGVLALMIGDTVIRGNYIQVTKSILERLDFSRYEIERIAIRVPKYTEASWVASQRRHANDIGVTLHDFIICIRRTK